MSIHLKFDYIDAYHCNEKRHAIEVLNELGITYQHSTPQTICDQFWFWNCENIPVKLPNYITILNCNPFEMIGFGLSEQQAQKIINHDYQRILTP